MHNLNCFVAYTCLGIVLLFFNGIDEPAALLAIPAAIFAFLWIRFGLSPETIRAGHERKFVIGHALAAIANVPAVAIIILLAISENVMMGWLLLLFPVLCALWIPSALLVQGARD